eukprot:scaffold116285_cov15-Phaeocystis_antarctica.AAC.1
MCLASDGLVRSSTAQQPVKRYLVITPTPRARSSTAPQPVKRSLSLLPLGARPSTAPQPGNGATVT